MKDFLDSDFEVFWTLRIAKWFWGLGVLFLWFFIPVGLVANPVTGLTEIVLWLPAAVIGTVVFRVCLECSISLLRIAEDVREINRKTAELDQQK